MHKCDEGKSTQQYHPQRGNPVAVRFPVVLPAESHPGTVGLKGE